MKFMDRKNVNSEVLSRKIRKNCMVFSGTDILKSIGILIAASILGYVFEWMGFAESNIIIVYVLAVLVISIVTVNRIYSLLASLVRALKNFHFFLSGSFSFILFSNLYLGKS